VENEDYVTSLLRFASGARGVLETSRVSVGEQNNHGFEIHGTEGAVFWDFRRMKHGLRRPEGGSWMINATAEQGGDRPEGL